MINKADLLADFVDQFEQTEKEQVEGDAWASLWAELYSTMSDSHIEMIQEQEQDMVKALRQGKKPEIPRLLSFGYNLVFMSYHGQLNHKLCLPEPVGQILIEFPRYPRLKDTIFCRQCSYPLPLGEIEGRTWITCPICGSAIKGTLDIKTNVPFIKE